MVPWVPLATVPRPLGQQNTLKSLFSGPNRGITDMRISIFDQNQEAEIFKFRWCRQSEFKNQLNLTSKILTRMLHITNINLCGHIHNYAHAIG